MRYQTLSLICVFLCAGQVLASEVAPSENTGEISLRKAVEITLQTSPNIAVQRLGVDKAEACARMASGAFDVTLLANINANEAHNKILDVEGLRAEDRQRLPANMELVHLHVNIIWKLWAH